MSKRTKLRALLAVGAGVVLLLIAFALSGEVMWVGFTDLTVEFVVTDARTGAPIPDAELAVLDFENTLDRANWKRFAFRVDENGIARHLSPCCMSSGRRSQFLPSRGTFAVYLPLWDVSASAPGYRAIEERYLGELCDARTVERTGPGQSRLVVPLKLEPLP